MKIPQPELSLHEYWTNWHAIPTCLSYAALYDFLAQEFTNNDVFVEVGGLLGKSATYMARKTIELRKDNTIILVDNLYGVEGDITMYTSIGQAKQAHALYTNFVATGVEKRCHLLTMPSPQAAHIFPDNFLGAVFIDGDHDYGPAKADITAWWPKIRPGGYLCGHDYGITFPGVDQAVAECFGGNPHSRPVQVVYAPATFSIRKPSI